MFKAAKLTFQCDFDLFRLTSNLLKFSYKFQEQRMIDE